MRRHTERQRWITAAELREQRFSQGCMERGRFICRIYNRHLGYQISKHSILIRAECRPPVQVAPSCRRECPIEARPPDRKCGSNRSFIIFGTEPRPGSIARALNALCRFVQDSQQAPQPHTLVKAKLPSICRRPGESSFPGPARALLGPGQQCRCRLLKLIMSSDQPRTDATCHGAIADPF